MVWYVNWLDGDSYKIKVDGSSPSQTTYKY